MSLFNFRGRRVDNGEWVYGNYWKHNSSEPINNAHYIRVDLEDKYYADFKDFEVRPDSVGQCTPEKDITGAEIYVGHIVEANAYHGNYLVAKQSVKVYAIWTLKSNNTLEDFKIIGDFK